MFLVKGVKLQGIITWFDNFSLLLRRDGQSQLVYKHAISTVMPSHDFDLSLLGDNVRDAPPSKGKALQDVFLNAVRRSNESVTMFLVNGEIGEHTSELQSLMRISYAVFCLKKKNNIILNTTQNAQIS